MLLAILKQAGLATFGLCILCASVEVHEIYRTYVNHEAAREQNIHIAYSNVLNRVAGIQQIANAIDVSQLQPPVTAQKINAKAR